ncbi:MAG: membrane protein insertion efficiency factor YidD [Deltaproteobacteria bacterium]|nr:membrane protein insertion efficiency factor YidD [Deltaproteobacteria bacterium]
MKNFFPRKFFTKKLPIFLVRGYQFFLSPLMGKECRFYPTCSEFSVEALEKIEFPKSFQIVIKRILCCHPFHAGGYHPVPLP